MNTIRHAAAKGNVKVVIQLLDLEREHGVGQEMDFDDVIALIQNTETEALQYFFDYYGQHYDLWKVMSDLVGDSGSYQVLQCLKKVLAIDLRLPQLKHGKCQFRVSWDIWWNNPRPIKERDQVGFALVMRSYENQLVPYLRRLFDKAITNPDPWTIGFLLTHTKERSIYKLNEKDEDGLTPLMKACMNDCSEYDSYEPFQCEDENGEPSCRITMVVKELLKCEELDPNIQNDCGFSAFMIACSNDTIAVGPLAKDRRVDITLQDHYGNNGFMIACALGRSASVWHILDAFKAHRIDIDSIDGQFRTAFFHKNMFGQDALMLCCIHSRWEIFNNDIRKLLDWESYEEPFYAMCTCQYESVADATKIFDALFLEVKWLKDEQNFLDNIKLSKAFIVTCKSDSLNFDIANKLMDELKRKGQGPTRYQKKVYVKMAERFMKHSYRKLPDKVRAKPFNYRKTLQQGMMSNGNGSIFDFSSDYDEFDRRHMQELNKELKRALTLSIAFTSWENHSNAKKYLEESITRVKDCKKLIREVIKIKKIRDGAKGSKKGTLTFMALKEVKKLNKRYSLIIKRETFKQRMLSKMIKKYEKVEERERIRMHKRWAEKEERRRNGQISDTEEDESEDEEIDEDESEDEEVAIANGF